MIGLCRDGDGTWKIKPSSSYFYLLKAGVYLHNTRLHTKYKIFYFFQLSIYTAYYAAYYVSIHLLNEIKKG